MFPFVPTVCCPVVRGRDSVTQEVMEDITVSVIITSQSMEHRRRVGSLDDLERESVKNYGKKCVSIGKNTDNNCMLKEYRTVFLALPMMAIY